jgi:thioredoxin-like negative regulator of GroEL
VDHPSGDGCAAMTRHQPHQYPSPEAIVRAALESAAGWAAFTHGWGKAEDTIRRLASDPANVAAIISAAAQLNKEQRDEEDWG